MGRKPPPLVVSSAEILAPVKLLQRQAVHVEIDHRPITADVDGMEIVGKKRHAGAFGHHRSTGLRPAFWERAVYFGLEKELNEALEGADAANG